MPQVVFQTMPCADICRWCKHSLLDNPHGFDQNDGSVDDDGSLIHSGTCTYCRLCNPVFAKEVEHGKD